MFHERLAQLHQLVPGLRSTELDRLAGLSPGHVSMIETGRRSNPTMSTAVGLARAFGVSVDWLISGEGEAPSPEHVRAAVAAARAHAMKGAA